MNVDDMVTLREDLTTYYATMHENMEEAAAFYHSEYTQMIVDYSAGKVSDFKPYKLPDAKTKTDILVDQTMSIGRVVNCEPWAESQKVKALAEKLKKWGQATLDESERHWSFNFVRDMTKQLILYGMTARKLLWNQDVWPDKPTTDDEMENAKYENKRKRAFPFYIATVNPINLKIDPSMEAPQFVIEEFERPAIMVKQLHPEWDMGKYNPMDMVKWWEFWTADEFCYFVENTPVGDIRENFMGFLPYEIGYSGFGEASPAAGPEYRAIGLVQAAMDSIRHKSELMTAIQYYIMSYAYGIPTVVEPPAQDFTIPQLGLVGVIPKHYEYENKLPPPLNQEAWRVLSFFDNAIDEATANPVLQGQRPGNARSGYDQAVSVSNARMRLVGPVNTTENILGKTLDQMGKLIHDQCDGPVTIGSTTVTPGDFEAEPYFTVRFEGETPEERDRRYQVGLSVWGKLSEDTIIRDFFGKDPVHEMEQKAVEQVLVSPTIQQSIANGAIKKFGFDRFIQGEEEAQAVQKRESARMPNRPITRQMQRLDQMGQPRPLGSPQEEPQYAE